MSTDDGQKAELESPILLSTRQAARLLGICERTLFSLTKKGEIPTVRIGRRVQYCREDLLGFVAARKAGRHGR